MDYDQFGLRATPPENPLAPYGWRPHFDRQRSDATAGLRPARVSAVHRNALSLVGPGAPDRVPPLADDTSPATVGDWLWIDPAQGRAAGRLTPFSHIARRAAGPEARLQPVAANVDTLFITSSVNADFNLARTERYLALAREAGIAPVLLLTKADQADDPDAIAAGARRALRDLVVETLDARDPAVAGRLAPWLTPGQTVAFVGSSGVGKSTLANTLMGTEVAETRGIREDDGKGRHTSTRRELHRLPGGAWIIDTPGMRELGLAEARAGIAAVFDDIEAIAAACRFRDCGHDAEPGCAVRAALEAGTLDTGRVTRWRKLLAEEARNSESIATRRAREKGFGKMVREVTRGHRKR